MNIFKEIGRNPHIDWITLLVTSIVVAAGLGYTGYTLYNAVINGSIKGADATESASSIKLDEKAISSVLDRFEEWKEVSRRTRAGYTGVSDPSI